MNKENLIGKIFGRLIVFKQVDKHYYLCRCECGNEKIVNKYRLLKGNTKSCGCLSKEVHSKIAYKLGKDNKILKRKWKNLPYDKVQSRLYNIWNHITDRCNNTTDIAYKDYGGRGINLCDEWLNFENFYYWAIKSGYEYGLTIDRINNNEGYSPNNCRWATAKQQARNRRSNILITYNNETHCIAEWAEILNIEDSLLRRLIRKNNGIIA